MQPTEDAILFADSLDNVDRVEELEDALLEILDLIEDGYLETADDATSTELAQVQNSIDKAWMVLQEQDDEEVL